MSEKEVFIQSQVAESKQVEEEEEISEVTGTNEVAETVISKEEDTIETESIKEDKRRRSMSLKAKENKIQELSKQFWEATRQYGKENKQMVTELQGNISQEKINLLYEKLKRQEEHIGMLYEELKGLWKEPDLELRRQADKIKADIEYLRETIQRKIEEMDEEKSKKSKRSRVSSIASRTSRTSSKIKETQAKIAAKKVELQAHQDAAIREEELRKLQEAEAARRAKAEADQARMKAEAEENEKKRINEENKKRAELKAKEDKKLAEMEEKENKRRAEAERAIIQKKREIERNHKEMEIKAEQAKLQVLQEEYEEEINRNQLYVQGDEQEVTQIEERQQEKSADREQQDEVIYLNGNRITNDHVETENNIEAPSVTSKVSETNSNIELIARTFADTFNQSRLPVPTPVIFSGDPLQFISFKKSFKALVESKGIPSTDKLYYLQQYLAGEARAAAEGCFYGNDEASYQRAWDKLESRFGHHFTIQQSFRKKLREWTKLYPKNGKGIQEYADYLDLLKEAMSHIEGLEVLNDCVQIQEMIYKLPDTCIHRWTRFVTSHMNKGNPYPNFEMLVDFVSEEAQVFNNPFCSTLENSNKGQERGPRNMLRNRGYSHNTKTSSQEEDTKKKICSSCDKEGHSIWKCRKFINLKYEDKLNLLKTKRLCFGCLRKGHASRECKTKVPCVKCGGKHHYLLHLDKTVNADSKNTQSIETQEVQEESENDTEEIESQEELEETPVKEAISYKVYKNEPSYTSMIVPVWVGIQDGGSPEVLTYALIDSQSDCSYISQDLASKLKKEATPTRMKISTLTSTSIIDCNKYTDVRIRGYDMNTEVILDSCYTKDLIPYDRSQIPCKRKLSKVPHLKHISTLIPPIQDCDVGLLIGYSCPQALRPIEIVSGPPKGSFAIKTDLGWSVVGEKNYPSKEESICHRVKNQEVPIVTPQEIVKLLDQDFKDTKDTNVTYSQDDLKFLNILKEGIRMDENGKISMPLPIKDENILPNNLFVAQYRLKSLKKKFRDEKYKKDYTKFMENMIEKGYVEEAAVPEEGQIINYIPHHGVYHPRKPDKIRVVFDASAKCNSISLNDQLLKGPDLTNKLIGVLLRFRQEPIAITCDIEQMFYNFEVQKEQRDLLRFLWWKNGNQEESPKEYRLKVHLFGATSSPGCANYGLKYLAEKYKDEYPKAAKFLSQNFYVDDGLQSSKDVQDAKELIEQATNLCKKGNIRLHKFLSNSKDVLQSIPATERAEVVSHVNLELYPLPVERTLGVVWNVENDSFTYKVSLKEKPLTRRGILSQVASIYDPLGLVSPVILQGKQILQEVCKEQKSWDEPLDTSICVRWESWKKGLPTLEDVQVPRCLKYKPEVESLELHNFSDASTSGYGQCSYLRVIYQDGNISSSLLMSKSRVAPSKVVSIPRLELAAAVVSVKVSQAIRKEMELKIDKEYFWTDSQVVLGYIANDARRFHVYVSNRVQYIREHTDISQWQYIETKENPADLASRGVNAKELINSNWLEGPQLLKERDIITERSNFKLILGDPEVKTQCLNTKSIKEKTGLLENLNKFSKWKSMINAIAILRRRLKGKESKLKENQDSSVQIIKWLQDAHYQQELSQLKKGEQVYSTSKIFNLSPLLDNNGILRVGGRINKAQHLPPDERNPIILPRKAHVTQKIIEDIHQEINHGGRSFTLNEIRAKGYYVHNGSKTVAQVIRNCVICRKLRRPVEHQKMADLPKERTEQQPVFYKSGMDVFGPYCIKKGRSEIKRYGLLFTCLYSRAIHVELLEDLSTDCFINALRCFLALRGVVRTIQCDQGTNFIGANNELRQALTELGHDRIERYLSNKQVEFIFNVPHASHQGGVWERQIRTVRNILSSVINLSNSRLDDSSLRTLFYEASYIVNSRPLSTVSQNDPLAESPITPNALLHGKLEGVLPPPGAFCQQDIYARKRWRRVQHLSEIFWNKWKREYLLNLQKRNKWQNPQRNIKEGDIVLLVEENSPRCEWPLGIISKTYPEEDGLVRKVSVKISNARAIQRGDKSKLVSEFQRPIQKIVLLIPVPDSLNF